MDYLVADIGGTNARLATVKPGQTQLSDVEVYSAAQYPSLKHVVENYLSSYPEKNVQTACFAVAAPVGSDSVQFTNNPWSFSIEGMRKMLRLNALYLINDFEAVAWCLSALKKQDLVALSASDRLNPLRPLAVLGPGTGLGIAASLLSPSGTRAVLATEGGHAAFAPVNEQDVAIWQILLKQNGFVSREDILCGQGLMRLSGAICKLDGGKLDLEIKAPSDITNGAIKLHDPHCIKVLNVFCSILGSVAGDVALQLGATGGVFIAGGIVPRFIDFLKQSPFLDGFLNKGRYRSYLEEVACHIITSPQPGLLGAATYCQLREKA